MYAVKNSVHALPKSEGAREDLEWVAHEIGADGGEASLCESRFIGGLTNNAMSKQLRFARQRDYVELSKEARRIVDSLSRTDRAGPGRTGRTGRIGPAACLKRRAQFEAALARIRKRAGEIIAIDHFGAPGRLKLDGLMRTAEDKLRPPRAADRGANADLPALRSVRGRTWVTPQGNLTVNRIASAWLIRRFIDPAATLRRRPPGEGLRPERGRAALRHVRCDAPTRVRCVPSRCCSRLGNSSPALRHIANMVSTTSSISATRSSAARRRADSPR